MLCKMKTPKIKLANNMTPKRTVTQLKNVTSTETAEQVPKWKQISHFNSRETQASTSNGRKEKPTAAANIAALLLS